MHFIMFGYYYYSCSSSRDEGSSIWTINSSAQNTLELFGTIWKKDEVVYGFFLRKLGLHHSMESFQIGKEKSAPSGLTAWSPRSDSHSLFGRGPTAPDHNLTASASRADPVSRDMHFYSFFFIPIDFNTHQENTPPLSFSHGEKALPCGEAFPIDPSPTGGIPGLTVMSSSIPSGYFIDSPSLSPWISLPRVHIVKDEDSILGHGFVGSMVGIV
jgi:hypothetical protein